MSGLPVFPISAADSLEASPSASRFEFATFSIDLRDHKLRQGHDVVALPARAFDTLAYLVAHPGRPIDKNEIIAVAWRGIAVTDASLVHAISVLRRALGDDSIQPSLIETIPRFGYRFIGTVKAVVDPPSVTQEPAQLDADPTVEESDLKGAPEQVHALPSTKSRWSFVRGWRQVAFACVVLGIAGLTVWSGNLGDRLRVSKDGQIFQLAQVAPTGTGIVSGGVVSPTGNDLAFVGIDEASGQTALWVTTLRSSEYKKLPGTTGARMPFWSPDGRELGFFMNEELLTTGLSGKSPRAIATVGTTPAGGSWGTNNEILFADWTKGLYTVSTEGGPVTKLTSIDYGPPESAMVWPQFLPDGRHFLFQLIGADVSRSGVYLGTIGSPESARLLDAESAAVYAPPGFLIYRRRDMLIAEEFDLSRLSLKGRPVVLSHHAPGASWQNGDVVSASRNVVAFREADVSQALHLVGRTGMEQHKVELPTNVANLRLSPDQKQVLWAGSTWDTHGLWVADLVLRQNTRLETDGIAPIWAPDGKRVAFTANRDLDVYVRPLGDANVQSLIRDNVRKELNDWSPDGREIVYTRLEPETRFDLWAWSVSEQRARPLLRTASNETHARISPDGRWIAYASDESGIPEVYVRTYPQMTDVQRISSGGGAQPQWRHDQSELFYLSPSNALMVALITNAGGAAAGPISFSAPHQLFRTSIVGHPFYTRDSYAVTADGQSMVYSAPDVEHQARISLIVNWAAGLKDWPANRLTTARRTIEPVLRPR